jgi:hypothetical protein
VSFVRNELIMLGGDRIRESVVTQKSIIHPTETICYVIPAESIKVKEVTIISGLN